MGTNPCSQVLKSIGKPYQWREGCHGSRDVPTGSRVASSKSRGIALHRVCDAVIRCGNDVLWTGGGGPDWEGADTGAAELSYLGLTRTILPGV